MYDRSREGDDVKKKKNEPGMCIKTSFQCQVYPYP